MERIIEYIPILTSLLALAFAFEMLLHYRLRPKQYVFWWMLGLFFYFLGTCAESINILFGWSEINFRFWYIIGAIWGGFPIAQGVVYLFMSKRFADISASFWIIYNAIAMFFIIKSPVRLEPGSIERMSGELFEWQWVRYFTPFVNLYSASFIIVWSLYSANKYFLQVNREAKFIACMNIFFGSILTVTGGTYARIGYPNVLYVTEFIGLFFTYYGMRTMRNSED